MMTVRRRVLFLVVASGGLLFEWTLVPSTWLHSVTNARPPRSRISLSACTQPNFDGEALCGSYDVYENRMRKTGRKISLNIVVLPALSPIHLPDPIFWLAGGPGAAATQTVRSASGGFLEVFRKDRDLVFVDQRGTGKSNPLNCDVGDNPANLEVFFGKLFPLDTVRACREKLQATSDLRQYTTPIAMDDLDEVREALGYSKINVVAASYGTIAAQVYMRQHRSSIRSVFLFGVATPRVKQPLLFARGAQHAMDLLFVDCAADDICKSEFPGLKKDFESVLSKFDNGPAQVEMVDPVTKKMRTVRLEKDNYVERLRLLTYTTTFSRFVPLVVHKASEGDFVPFETISIAYNPGSLLSRGMYLTVTCSEGMPFISEQEIVTEAKGTFVGEDRVRVHQEACKQWPAREIPRTYIDPVKSDLPIMMISGELDGSTPPWFGKDAIQYLTKGKQITVRYYGHQLDSPCAWEIMHKFVDNASVRGIDTSCTEKIRRPAFATEIPLQFSLRR